MTNRRAAIAVFAVALVLRIAPALVLPPERVVFPDSRHYMQFAENVARGEGYRDWAGDRAIRLPTYPLFLAAHRVVFGDALLPVQLTQAILGALTCLLLWRLGRRTVGERPALFAAGVTAVYPLLVVSSALFLIETLLAFLIVLELLLLKDGAETARPGRAAAAGLAGGAASLIQAAHGLLFVFLLPLAWWAAPRRRTAVLLAFTAGSLLLPGIWTARNWLVLDAFVPVSTRSGLALDSAFRLSMRREGKWVPPPPRSNQKEIEHDASLYRSGAELARRDPARTVRLALLKQQRFWNPIPNYSGFRNPSGMLLTLPFLPVFLLFLVGLVRLPRTDPRAMWLLIPVVYMGAVYLVYVGSIRYRLAIEPLLIAIAAAVLWDLVRAWKARRAPKETGPTPAP